MAASKLLCGVDLGGTKLSAGLFAQSGEQVDKLEIRDHIGRDNDEVTELIVGLVVQLLSRNRIQESALQGIGIGVAAHIRFRQGLIIASSNYKIPFRNYPMRDRVQTRFTVPVTLDNDANAQAYGELLFGAGRGRKDIVFVTVSSGIGAGIIVDGRLLRGVTGTAGEIGHTITHFEAGQRCTCGNTGCLMAQSSGLFFPALFRAKLEAGKRTAMDIPDLATVDGPLIAAGFARGDEICTEIYRESARTIGVAVYNVFQTLNPEAVILGGGLLNLGQEYIEEVRRTFYSYVREMMYDRMEIVLAELGSDSGLIGAAALVLEQG